MSNRSSLWLGAFFYELLRFIALGAASWFVLAIALRAPYGAFLFSVWLAGSGLALGAGFFQLWRSQGDGRIELILAIGKGVSVWTGIPALFGLQPLLSATEPFLLSVGVMAIVLATIIADIILFVFLLRQALARFREQNASRTELPDYEHIEIEEPEQ